MVFCLFVCLKIFLARLHILLAMMSCFCSAIDSQQMKNNLSLKDATWYWGCPQIKHMISCRHEEIHWPLSCKAMNIFELNRFECLEDVASNAIKGKNLPFLNKCNLSCHIKISMIFVLFLTCFVFVSYSDQHILHMNG